MEWLLTFFDTRDDILLLCTQRRKRQDAKYLISMYTRVYELSHTCRPCRKCWRIILRRVTYVRKKPIHYSERRARVLYQHGSVDQTSGSRARDFQVTTGKKSDGNSISLEYLRIGRRTYLRDLEARWIARCGYLLVLRGVLSDDDGRRSATSALVAVGGRLRCHPGEICVPTGLHVSVVTGDHDCTTNITLLHTCTYTGTYDHWYD